MNDQEKFDKLLLEYEAFGPSWVNNNPLRQAIYRKLKRLPRANRHTVTCNCEACQSIRRKDGGVNYAVKVPRSLREKLKVIGANRVREVLRKLAEES